MKHSLVIGGTGQDGAFLCKALLRKEHQVSATFRVGGRGFDKVEELGIRENITWLSFNLGQSSNLLNYIRENKPEHIYSIRVV